MSYSLWPYKSWQASHTTPADPRTKPSKPPGSSSRVMDEMPPEPRDGLLLGSMQASAPAKDRRLPIWAALRLHTQNVLHSQQGMTPETFRPAVAFRVRRMPLTSRNVPLRINPH